MSVVAVYLCFGVTCSDYAGEWIVAINALFRLCFLLQSGLLCVVLYTADVNINARLVLRVREYVFSFVLYFEKREFFLHSIRINILKIRHQKI